MIKVDRHTIIQILGSLMNKPSLLDDVDKYRLEFTDFHTTFDRYVFSAINNLYNLGDGATVIRAIDIINYLKENGTAKSLMEKENGDVFLRDCEAYGEPANFVYYYNKLKKMNFLRDIQSTGHNIEKFYCEDILNPKYSEINNNFEKMSVDDILNELRLEVDSYESRYVLKTTTEESKATDGIQELIKNLKVIPEIGCKLQGDIINTVCRGGRKGKLYLRSAGSGVGKCIPNYTQIPTKEGLRRVEDIKVGDFLFDRKGHLTKVLAVYPQKHKKRVCKIFFESGRVAECCDEHLWTYYDDTLNDGIMHTDSLKNICKKMKEERIEISIPCNSAVKYPTAPFTEDILDFETALFILGNSSTASLGSIFQRKEILRTILSGCTGHPSDVDIVCESFLTKKIVNLCFSIGVYCSVKKVNLNGQIVDGISISYTKKTDKILRIENSDTFTDMTCFYVDNVEHLFLMNDYICTHNTRSMVGDACAIAYPIRFDRKSQKWISTGSAEKVLYVMTEQDPAEIQTMILAYLTGYNEEIFLYGTYGDNEMPRIKQAVEIMEKYKNNMLFARIPDPCASAVKILFRKYNTQFGVENFFYDYIFSSPAMLNEYRDLKLREDVCLRLFTTALKNLAVELNVFILSSTQISNDDDEKGGFRDFHCVQGSKAIVNLCDFACIMSRPTPYELQALKGFEEAYSFTPNLVTDVYKNRRGRWNMIRIWSMNDLGSCRKEDLFVTTADMKPIRDFSSVFFDFKNNEEYEELCNKYNKLVVFDKIETSNDLYQSSNVDINDTMDEIENAFLNEESNRKRLADTSFSELLGV